VGGGDIAGGGAAEEEVGEMESDDVPVAIVEEDIGIGDGVGDEAGD